jgi:PAS domain S-box-containing protein
MRERSVAQMGLLAALYFGAAKAGLLLATVGAQVTLAWPPTGIALTILLLGGLRLWPGVAIGAILVNASTGVPLATACGMGTGNTLEAVLAVLLLRRVEFHPSLDRLRDVFALLVLAAGLSTIASATIGVASLVLGGVLSWQATPTAWGTWWLGDALGDIVVAPALLVWMARPGRPLSRQRAPEAALLLAATVATGLSVFGGWFGASSIYVPAVYLVFPLVLWATLRFGPPGVVLFTLVVSSLALWGTVEATRPFVEGPLLRFNLLNTQLFMGIVGVTGLILAAAVTERERALTEVRALNTELEQRVGERTGQLVAANTDLRKQAELLDLAHDAIIVRDLTHSTILFWNKGAEVLYGWTKEEAIGLTMHALVRSRLPEPLDSILATLMRHGRWSGELEHTTRDGRAIIVESHWTLRLDADGQPDAFLEINTDITARTVAAVALRESESRLRTVIGSAPIILFALDVAGVVRLCEGQGLDTLGLAPGAVMGHPISLLYRDDPAIRAAVHRALAGEDSAIVSQVDAVALDTRLVALRDEHGDVRGVIGVATDVTERVRAEAAERALQARDEFLSVAAHELKTPLTSLRGFTQVALGYLTGDRPVAPERLQRALRQIESQTDKVNRLVDHLLDVTHLEAGRLTLERRETDLAHLADEVAVAAQAQTSAHTLVVTAPSTFWAWVDPLRLEQVLTNLVGNAIKYSPQGGIITITVGLDSPGTAVRLEVRDQGLGIPEEHRAYIFDRFYQAHASSYRSGLGLGLYISQQIVVLHGGQLTAEFPPEGGALFVVCLPHDRDTPEHATREEAAAHGQTGIGDR